MRLDLRMMKPTAYIINAARGGVIDEAALADALANNRLVVRP
jgi:lactate dehydrogenase-like 2-hydroxyacid dehydrogenase